MSLPMTEAKYLARACGAAQFEESSNNNMQISIPFEIIDEEYAGHTITWFATLHGTVDKKGKTGKERVVESLVAMGWQGDDMTDLVEIDDDTARGLMPDTVELVCAPDTFEGVDRLKVKWVNRAGSGRAGFKKPLGKADLKAFAAQMKSTIRNAKGGAPKPNGSKPAQPQHPNAPGNRDDDLPF